MESTTTTWPTPSIPNPDSSSPAASEMDPTASSNLALIKLTDTNSEEEEESETIDETNTADYMNGFKIGDMVWGKVKSHPWWPGHIYDESFAAPPVRRTRSPDHVLVAFFGDSSYGYFNPADLLPFSPHFLEKSAQTSSRPFLKAIDESVDEISRRGALAVSCRCRNIDNFAPTGVPGYLRVDVPGYKSGEVYSEEQIEEARGSFVPEEAVGFVRELAVAPKVVAGMRDAEFIRTMAMMLAYRTAKYEEFDETYAQAFGVEPARVPPGGEKVTQRAAPLAGQQRTPENLSKKKRSSTSKASGKLVSGGPVMITTAKKNKFVLKRRDDAHGGTQSSSFDHMTQPFAALPDVHPSAPGFSSDATASSQMHGNDAYVLQRRAAPADLTSYVDAAPVFVSSDGINQETVAVEAGQAKKVKEKIRKHKRDDVDVAAVEVKKKKKKLAELDIAIAAANAQAGSAMPAKAKKVKKAASDKQSRDNELTRTIPALPLPKLDPASLDLPEVVSDMQQLAVNPIHATEHGAVNTVRSLVLNFRSKVYQKSLANAPPGQLDTAEAHGIKSFVEQQPSKVPKVPKKKPILKPDDPTKAGKKRAPSDRQEELTAKKKKKVEQIKTLAAEKKAALSQKDSNVAAATAQAQMSMAAPPSRSSNKSEAPAKKKEANAPRKPSPTALMMKFPPRSTLPSVASLKARFARFGPLDLDAIRVYWKSHMCKVIYRYRSDAQIAMNYARNNDIFGHGQGNAHYYLRDVETGSSDPPTDSSSQREDSWLVETSPFRPGSAAGTLTQPRPLPLRPATGQPKSILKSGAAAGAAKETPRVTFMLSDGSNKVEPAPAVPPTNAKSNGSNGPDLAMNKNPKTVSFLPPQPPMARPGFSTFQPASRAADAHRLPPPPPTLPPRTSSGSFQTPMHVTSGVEAQIPMPVQANAQAGQSGRNGQQPQQLGYNNEHKSWDDFERQMLSLLVQCNDIVNNIKNTLGYMPYHPI